MFYIHNENAACALNKSIIKRHELSSSFSLFSLQIGHALTASMLKMPFSTTANTGYINKM